MGTLLEGSTDTEVFLNQDIGHPTLRLLKVRQGEEISLKRVVRLIVKAHGCRNFFAKSSFIEIGSFISEAPFVCEVGTSQSHLIKADISSVKLSFVRRTLLGMSVFIYFLYIILRKIIALRNKPRNTYQKNCVTVKKRGHFEESSQMPLKY